MAEFTSEYRITMEDLARIIQDNYATKADLDERTDHIESFIQDENTKLAEMIAKIPTRDELH